MLDAARIPARRRERDATSSARHRRRAAHVLQPDAARRHRRRDRRRRGRGARGHRRCAPRRTARRARRSSTASRRFRTSSSRSATRTCRRWAPRTTRSSPRTRRSARRNTVLADMFLIETERGCSRGCTYCVMRRSTNGGMRIVPAERVLESIPGDARRVGLVGAAVSDHPKIVAIVERARRPRMRGGALVAPARPPRQHRGVRRGARARRLPDAHDGDGRHERARARDARPPRPAQAPRCGAPSSRSSTGWTGSSST